MIIIALVCCRCWFYKGRLVAKEDKKRWWSIHTKKAIQIGQLFCKLRDITPVRTRYRIYLFEEETCIAYYVTASH